MIGPESLKYRLIAATPIPLDSTGDLHQAGLQSLIATMVRSSVGGVAADTLLGRGSRISQDRRAGLLESWRDGLGKDRLLMALASASPEHRRPFDVFQGALAMARQAASFGGDLLLVEPPGAVRGRPERDRLVLEYHSEVAQAGLPMLISYRREASGGIGYGPDVLAQLLGRPEVMGVVVDTQDGIATFQQVEALARESAPTKVVVSGEERFLGYSLMCGADAALVGIGCAFPDQVVELLEAHFTKDAPRFLALSAEVDRLARTLFAPPVDGSVLRLLWTLVQSGALPFEAANDPWSVPVGRIPFEKLFESLLKLDPDGPWQRGRWPEGST